jgi:hypothetical protein
MIENSYSYIKGRVSLKQIGIFAILLSRGLPIPNWILPQSAYVSMKEGSLFCIVVMRSTELGCFRSCSWCLWKALDEEGCMGLVP